MLLLGARCRDREVSSIVFVRRGKRQNIDWRSFMDGLGELVAGKGSGFCHWGRWRLHRFVCRSAPAWVPVESTVVESRMCLSTISIGLWLGLMVPAFAADDGAVETAPAAADADKAWAKNREELAALVKGASLIVRGEVLTTRDDVEAEGRVTKLAIVVRESFVGSSKEGAVVELELALGGAISGDTQTQPVPVRGYSVVVFSGENGKVLENGVFLVEGGYIWRPAREGVLMSPRLQRDWGEVADPIGDYRVFRIEDLRARADERNAHGANASKGR